MRALLDINVLIALHDRDHIHHERAALWLEAHMGHGWATCPLTQNGCLRIMSQPGYSHPLPLASLVSMLQGSTATAFHQLWADDISVLDSERFHHPHIHGPRQLTDLYLLALAVKNAGRLVTFDVRIPLSAVHGATADHLVTL
jgi:toxin-antitoxin system PIN domain toxin